MKKLAAILILSVMPTFAMIPGYVPPGQAANYVNTRVLFASDWMITLFIFATL